MKNVIALFVLVLILACSAFAYFSYSTIPDTPPAYYDQSTIHHGSTIPVTNYYPDGTSRRYVFEGIHPSGSQLLDKDGNLMEENVYAVSDRDGQPVLVVAETKYHTFWGRYHAVTALVLLLAGLAGLASWTFIAKKTKNMS